MQWRLLSRLAWRNLWRNRRRTLIMLLAITVGVWAMIFMTALMRGMVDQMVANGLKTFTGHLQIHQKDYPSDPAIVNSMHWPSSELEEKLNNTLAWTPRVRVPAVVSSERESRGITLMGIQAKTEVQLSFVAENIIEGRFIEADTDRGIVIGKKLADKLETRLGKRVVIMSQDKANNIVDVGARIVGIYKAELSATEEQFVFMGLKRTQQFLRLDNEISEIEILTADFRNADGTKLAIVDGLNENQEIKSWKEVDPYLASMYSVMDGFVLVWMLVIFIALSFGLVNTLIMAVFERTREFGLMLALGIEPRNILLQVILESLFLLALGLLIGTNLAWFGLKPLQGGIDVSVVAEGMEMMGTGAVLYPALYLRDVVLANAIVILLGLLASVLPAYKASKLQPVSALTVN